jgi:hypothetical protein
MSSSPLTPGRESIGDRRGGGASIAVVVVAAAATSAKESSRSISCTESKADNVMYEFASSVNQYFLLTNPPSEEQFFVVLLGRHALNKFQKRSQKLKFRSTFFFPV